MTDTDKTVIKPDTSEYTSARSSSGAKSKHNGSPVAIALQGMNIDEVKEVADSLDIDDVNRYDHLNIGQQRMNTGNRIRGRVKAIDVENARLEAAAVKDDASKADINAAKKLVSGEDQLAKACKTIRVLVDKREASAVKDRETTARAARAAKAVKDAKAEKKAA